MEWRGNDIIQLHVQVTHLEDLARKIIRSSSKTVESSAYKMQCVDLIRDKAAEIFEE